MNQLRSTPRFCDIAPGGIRKSLIPPDCALLNWAVCDAEPTCLPSSQALSCVILVLTACLGDRLIAIMQVLPLQRCKPTRPCLVQTACSGHMARVSQADVPLALCPGR